MLTLSISTTVQAQNWKYQVYDSEDEKQYHLFSETPGTVFGCHNNSGSSEIRFMCSDKDSKLRAFIQVNGCNLGTNGTFASMNQDIYLSFRKQHDMMAKGMTIIVDGIGTISSELVEVSTFHDMILGSEGYFPTKMQIATSGTFSTEHHFSSTHAFDFQNEFTKFPTQCKSLITDKSVW